MAARKSLPSDDDYWESSQAQKASRRLNLFDDDVSADSAKQALKHMKLQDFDEDDDIDTITWDGKEVNTKIDISSSSARFRTSPSSGSNVPRTSLSQVPTQPPAGRRPIAMQSSTVTSPLHTEISISDAVAKSSPKAPSQPSQTEVAKLETEVNFLKRQLHASKKDRFAQITPRETVKRMIMGEPYSLESYKGKEDKLQLLDEAIGHHDGNAITAIILFLKDTVKHSIFQNELFSRPIAVEHYLNYLRQHYEFEKLVDMLAYLGRTEEAAMIKFRQAVSVSNSETKIRTLQTCQRTHFNMEPSLSHEGSLIQEQYSLLERQLPVDKADALEQQKGVPMFRDYPRKASIIDTPVITTLYYMCFYHYKLPENNLASPLALRKAHRLTDRQFVWIAMAALAKLRRWPDMEALFQTKGWLGGTKMKAIVPFDRATHLLHKLAAPREVCEKYCNLIDDTHRRLEVAKKLTIHGSIIKTYADMRDRQAIEMYQSKLKPHSQEWFFANDMLRNSSIKWKN